jgi:hypothetical protein
MDTLLLYITRFEKDVSRRGDRRMQERLYGDSQQWITTHLHLRCGLCGDWLAFF